MTTIAPFTRLSRALSIFVTVVVVAVGGMIVGAPKAEAATCLSASCNGLWPHDEGCAGGTVLEEVLFLQQSQGHNPAAAIQLRKRTECGTARWARMVWDGWENFPPLRFNFKVERQEFFGGSLGWLTTISQSRTTLGGAGVWVTRMVAGSSNADARHRACTRHAQSLGFDADGDHIWSSYSSWICTDWQVGPG